MDGEIGPGGPGLELELEVECRTSHRASRGRKHPVTITADWQLESPHDLAAERVAVAFGGYTSCLDLADHVLPAAREAVQLLARQIPAGVTSLPARGWMVGDPAPGCRCARGFFGTAPQAGAHTRTVEHLGTKYGASQKQLLAVLGAVGARQRFQVPPDPTGRIARLVRESMGLSDLWAAGVHPEAVEEAAALVPGLAEALPTSYYLGVLTRPVDREWLAATLAHRPDPDVATWVVWSDQAVNPTSHESCGAWLAMGVPVRALEALLDAGTAPADAHALADRTGRTPRQSALYLADWAQAGCHPTPEHVLLLDQHGITPAYRPPVTAVNLLEVTAAELGEPPSRADLAAMLALAGTRVAVVDLLERGVSTPFDLLVSG